MERFNKYQKIQLVLLILILVAGLAFGRLFLKRKDSKKFELQEVSAGVTEIIDEKEKKNMLISEDGQELQENVEDTSWDEQDVEDTEVNMEEEKKKEEENKTSYYIKVNYTANCVTVYKKDDSGNYTIPVKALICSTGAATPTSGVYKTSNKYRWHQLNGGVYGQYCTRITGHILFHSVPSSSNTPDSLKYTAYDKLGTRASAGCVRLTVEGAMWIYNNCASGTYVEFYSSSNPGPLGKPTAMKISSNVQCRNWDPTDPDPRNPWHTYVEPASTQTEPVNEQPQTTIPSSTPQEQQEPQVQQETQEQQEPQNPTPVVTDEPKQDDDSKEEPSKPDEPKQNENTNNNINNNTNTGKTGEKPSQDTPNDDTTSGGETKQDSEEETE